MLHVDQTMKTFEQIRAEVLMNPEHFLKHEPGCFPSYISFAHVEKLAAKEYAKQWIERAAEKAQTEMIRGGVKWIDATSIRNIKNEIDRHGER